MSTQGVRLVVCVLTLGFLGSAAAQDRCYEHDAAGNLSRVFETDLNKDVLNCGTCGQRCSEQTPLCVHAACQACEARTDGDCDGIPTSDDNCPIKKNPDQLDTDDDDVGDVCDNCPSVKNQDQLNTDGANDGGNACDLDDDNDSCPDVTDDKPLFDSGVVGWRMAVNCPKSSEDVFGSDKVDTDDDGLLNCDIDETDDDNDGVPDADDRCPVHVGTDDLLCQSAPVSCGIRIPWNVCLFGGCNEYLIKVVSVINPAIFIQNFRIQQQSALILYSTASQPISAIQNALLADTAQATEIKTRKLAQPSKVTLEIWTKTPKGKAGKRVGVLAEFDASSLRQLDDMGDGALILTKLDGQSFSLQRRDPPVTLPEPADKSFIGPPGQPKTNEPTQRKD